MKCTNASCTREARCRSGLCSQCYQRAYHQANKEKAAAYQRKYQKTYKSNRGERKQIAPGGGRKPVVLKYQRPVVVEAWNGSGLQHLSVEKLTSEVTAILSGKKRFVERKR